MKRKRIPKNQITFDSKDYKAETFIIKYGDLLDIIMYLEMKINNKIKLPDEVQEIYNRWKELVLQCNKEYILYYNEVMHISCYLNCQNDSTKYLDKLGKRMWEWVLDNL